MDKKEQEFILWYYPNKDLVKKYGIKKVRKYSGTENECIEKMNELMERFKESKDRFKLELIND